jgi:predicted HicB family RNase H-like nuclease
LVEAFDEGCEMAETVVHFQIRMPPSRHESLASRAREEKSSLNALIVSILRDAVEQREAASTKAGSPPTPLA